MGGEGPESFDTAASSGSIISAPKTGTLEEKLAPLPQTPCELP